MDEQSDPLLHILLIAILFNFVDKKR